MLSVVVASYGPIGNPYAQFVDRWWRGVLRMNPRPAEVIVAHTLPEPLGLLEYPVSGIAVRSVVVSVSDAASVYNAGVEAASQPWISTIGVDDTYRPDALALLQDADAAGADIMLWDHYELGSHVWNCFWDPKTLKTANTVQGSSPFRRELWRRVGGFPRIGWFDWGFWLRCAKAGAKAFATHRVGVDFDPGIHHVTHSGQAAPIEAKRYRDAELAAFAEALWA